MLCSCIIDRQVTTRICVYIFPWVQSFSSYYCVFGSPKRYTIVQVHDSHVKISWSRLCIGCIPNQSIITDRTWCIWPVYPSSTRIFDPLDESLSRFGKRRGVRKVFEYSLYSEYGRTVEETNSSNICIIALGIIIRNIVYVCRSDTPHDYDQTRINFQIKNVQKEPRAPTEPLRNPKTLMGPRTLTDNHSQKWTRELNELHHHPLGFWDTTGITNQINRPNPATTTHHQRHTRCPNVYYA